MIQIFENVLPAAEVDQFLNHLAQSEHWEGGNNTAGSLASQVKDNAQLSEHCELAITLGNHILKTLGALAPFISFALPDKIYPPRFNRYADEQHYGFHVDSAIMQIPDSRQSMRTDLSATLFLSAPESYEGGELQFQFGTDIQSIKLPAGSMVVYPSNTLHQVTPVTAGTRVCSFFWIQSMIQQHDQRILLNELDQSIQNLTRLKQDTTEINNLSKIYHNLLRQWSTL